jgi:inner membrane protein
VHIGIIVLLYILLWDTVKGLGTVVLAAVLLGSLFPDVDHPHSILGRFNPLAWLGIMHHRGWTHTIMGLLVFSAVVCVISIPAGIGFAAGYMSHLLMDGCLRIRAGA